MSHAAASVLFQNSYSVTVMRIAFFPHSNNNLAHERVPYPLVNMVPSNVAFYSNRSHSSRISTASHLHLSPCASLWLRPVRAILYTWLTYLRGTDDLYDATLECTRGKFFPVWRKIRNCRFGIFNFDAELEWCKFRAPTVSFISRYPGILGVEVAINCILTRTSHQRTTSEERTKTLLPKCPLFGGSTVELILGMKLWSLPPLLHPAV